MNRRDQHVWIHFKCNRLMVNAQLYHRWDIIIMSIYTFCNGITIHTIGISILFLLNELKWCYNIWSNNSFALFITYAIKLTKFFTTYRFIFLFKIFYSISLEFSFMPNGNITCVSEIPCQWVQLYCIFMDTQKGFLFSWRY